jgi:hypothetical protein
MMRQSRRCGCSRSLSSFVPLVLGLPLAVVSFPRTALADDAACFAASENEIGLRKEGKLREAIKQLTVCAAPSCPAEVASECGRRLIELNKALPTIIVSATDASGNDVAAVTVTVDGAPFATSLSGLSLPIEPGSHTLRFAAGGAPMVERTVVIKQGEKDRHINVTLGSSTAATSAPSTPPAGAWSTQKTLAVVSAGVGVAGFVAGAVTGVIALSDTSATHSDCTPTLCSTQGHASALSEHSSASTMGAVSTAGFIVGAVGLAGAGVLWFTAPKGEKRSASALRSGPVRLQPIVGPGGGLVMMSGSFE